MSIFTQHIIIILYSVYPRSMKDIHTSPGNNTTLLMRNMVID